MKRLTTVLALVALAIVETAIRASAQQMNEARPAVQLYQHLPTVHGFDEFFGTSTI